jgi:hypothetical protein
MGYNPIGRVSGWGSSLRLGLVLGLGYREKKAGRRHFTEL